MAATPAMRASPAAFRVTVVPVGCPTTMFAMGTARAIKARMVSKTARRFMTPPPFGSPPLAAAHPGPPYPGFPQGASRSPTGLGTLAFPPGPVKAAAPKVVSQFRFRGASHRHARRQDHCRLPYLYL